MLDWKQFDRNNPPKNSKYIVYCVAPQFDADWIDLARFDDGRWHNFGCPVSNDLRVRQYAELNYPNVVIEGLPEGSPSRMEGSTQ